MKMRIDDINLKGKDKFKTTAERNPLDPQYVRITNSNWRMVIKQEGHHPTSNISPKTKWNALRLDDIEGAQIKQTSFLEKQLLSWKEAIPRPILPGYKDKAINMS